MSDDAIQAVGTVIKVDRGDIHHVEVVLGDVARVVKVRRSGRMARARVRCLAGDRVRVELSAYDPSRGRIVYREG